LVGIDREALKETPLSDEEKSKLKSVSGQISWVTGQTRPDIAFDCCQIANAGKNASIGDLRYANKTINKLKTQDVKIVTPAFKEIEKSDIVCFSDATHASLRCGSSQGAHIIFLKENEKVIPIAWQSKKLQRVTKSPLASETLALSEGVDASHFVAAIFKEIFCLSHLPIVKCITDSKSLFELLRTTNVTKDLRLRVDIARLRQLLENEIDVQWIEGSYQLADCLTKSGASSNLLLNVLQYASLNYLS